MSKKRIILRIIFFIGLLILASYFIPRETKPSADTRIILEHNKKAYIAPLCFEDSDPTNYLGDSTLGKAKELNYKPNSSCTEEALKGEKDSLFISLLKDIGILSKKWDDW